MSSDRVRSWVSLVYLSVSNNKVLVLDGGRCGRSPTYNRQVVMTISIEQTLESTLQRAIVLVQGAFKTNRSYRSVVERAEPEGEDEALLSP